MPNTLKDSQENNQDIQAKNLNADKNNEPQENIESQNTVAIANLPVLAKDEYYLSRLERDLARMAVSKT